ncbi:MAG: hypothetical protein J6S14_02310 [Clostridia bacterium]|nr:hypothetical protein [Clostridia bacterium]
MTNEERRDALIKESLLYERCVSRLSRISNRLAHERNSENKKALENGEAADLSFKVVIDALTELTKEYRKRSDKAWNEARKLTPRFEEGYELLANAVLENAAMNYEAALCGTVGAKNQKTMIEIFSRYGAELYTDLDFEKVLQIIRKEHPKFVKKAHEHAAQIIRETEERRKANKDLTENSVKCPLCGYGMYSALHSGNGAYLIRCTGCNFSEYVSVADE